MPCYLSQIVPLTVGHVLVNQMIHNSGHEKSWNKAPRKANQKPKFDSSQCSGLFKVLQLLSLSQYKFYQLPFGCILYIVD